MPFLGFLLSLMREKDQQETAAKLLTQLADALNALNRAGIPARLKHGAVYTEGGYVLPTDAGRWVARTLLYTELEPSDNPDNEDD